VERHRGLPGIPAQARKMFQGPSCGSQRRSNLLRRRAASRREMRSGGQLLGQDHDIAREHRSQAEQDGSVEFGFGPGEHVGTSLKRVCSSFSKLRASLGNARCDLR
jgi:hypothetical protein